MQSDKEQGKKRKYQGYLDVDYRIIGTWVTGGQGQLEETQIDYEIRKHMERFMTDNRLFKTPGHHENWTDICLWK